MLLFSWISLIHQWGSKTLYWTDFHYKVWWSQFGMNYSWKWEKFSEFAQVQVAIVRLAIGFWQKNYLWEWKIKSVSLANGKEAWPWVFDHRKIFLLTWEQRSTLVRLCVWEFSSGFLGAVESNSWSDLSPLICTLTVNGCSNRDPAKREGNNVTDLKYRILYVFECTC